MSAPLSYLTAAGPAARPVLALDWGLLAISCAVVVIIAGLLGYALARRRRAAGPDELEAGTDAGKWISIGVGISSAVLLAAAVWMLIVLHEVREPASARAVRVDVIAHQFWWSFHYAADADGGDAFTTANELHIPVGVPVYLRVTSADVIHSFWVPKLAGKMDMIPGQINETWIEADGPGVYRGQCGEFCGLEHAGMAFVVVAEPADAFRAWRRHQLEPPAAAAARTASAVLFRARCGSCHAVRGTAADGTVAPDLSHFAARRSLASGVLPNDPAALRDWLHDPDAVKPGTPMPDPDLSDREVGMIVSYLDSLN